MGVAERAWAERLPARACAQPYADRRGKAELDLRSYCWANDHTQVKCAYLSGPRAEIFNLMGYPGDPFQVPVLAVEIILFGGQPRVAVLDLQPAGGLASWSQAAQEGVRDCLRCLEPYRAQLSPGGELPEWARAHFTPWCIFSRPQSAQEMPFVIEAFGALVRAWSQRFLPLDRSGPPQSGLLEYLAHHQHNTPGRRFLHTSFGPEWSEDYLENFMYSLTLPEHPCLAG